jgi:hypothetical protein
LNVTYQCEDLTRAEREPNHWLAGMLIRSGANYSVAVGT